jgi:hypothetical protein
MVGLVACGSHPGEQVAVNERDYSITLERAAVGRGRLDLMVTNQGPSGHELLIFRTGLADGALPLGPDGRIDEDHGSGIVKVFDSGSDIPAGRRRPLHTTLGAGRYVVVCNLANHYQLGMHTTLTVA